MTRLSEKKSGADPSGYHSAIFDIDKNGNSGRGSNGSSGSTMKRSRPYRSSLDYKLGAEDPSMFVTPPPNHQGARGGGDGGGDGDGPPPPPPRMGTSTRARGSSGIPPQQLTLDDLHHLDEETLTRVLYENPHLAGWWWWKST